MIKFIGCTEKDITFTYCHVQVLGCPCLLSCKIKIWKCRFASSPVASFFLNFKSNSIDAIWLWKFKTNWIIFNLLPGNHVWRTCLAYVSHHDVISFQFITVGERFTMKCCFLTKLKILNFNAHMLCVSASKDTQHGFARSSSAWPEVYRVQFSKFVCIHLICQTSISGSDLWTVFQPARLPIWIGAAGILNKWNFEFLNHK